MNDKENKINSLRAKIKSFVIKTINLCKTLPDDKIGKVLTNQLLRSSTSDEIVRIFSSIIRNRKGYQKPNTE